MIKITYVCGNDVYVAKPIQLTDVPNINPSVIGRMAFYLDTPTVIGDYLPINKEGDTFTFVGLLLLSSIQGPQGPYFKLQKINDSYIMNESTTIDGNYFRVSGIIIIRDGMIFSETADNLTFRIDEILAEDMPDIGDSPLPPATRPLKSEKGVTKDNPSKGGFGVGGLILLLVLLLILGIALLYLLLRDNGND